MTTKDVSRDLPGSPEIKTWPFNAGTPVWFLGQEDLLERDRLPTPVFLGFPDGSAGKESACNAGNPGSIPRSGRSTGEGIDYPLQCSWASLVTQLVKNPPAMCETWVWSLGWEDPLEKGKRLPTPVFWPGEFHGLYSPWGGKESDTTEWLSLSK